MRNLLAGLDAALGAFQADLDARGHQRRHHRRDDRVRPPRRRERHGGTDHGFGCVMLVLGAQRRTAAVYGDWAGLSPDVIGARGDVVPTVDFRNVLGDCAQDVLGVANPVTLFPGYTYSPLGIFSP